MEREGAVVQEVQKELSADVDALVASMQKSLRVMSVQFKADIDTACASVTKRSTDAFLQAQESGEKVKKIEETLVKRIKKYIDDILQQVHIWVNKCFEKFHELKEGAKGMVKSISEFLHNLKDSMIKYIKEVFGGIKTKVEKKGEELTSAVKKGREELKEKVGHVVSNSLKQIAAMTPDLVMPIMQLAAVGQEAARRAKLKMQGVRGATAT